jgi:hypothetical protein
MEQINREIGLDRMLGRSGATSGLAENGSDKGMGEETEVNHVTHGS